MRAETRKFLHDMIEACRSVREFMAGKTLTDYRSSKLLRSAVERQLITIGEAMTQLRKLDSSVVDGIRNSRRVIAFRNLAVHGYDAVDDEVVYTIAIRDVPTLQSDLESTLDTTVAEEARE